MRTAVISACEQYRYQLSREWFDGKGTVLWIMLNPSTADASVDDPTIRRCVSFSQAWGFSGLLVGNLYAYRATDPHRVLNLPTLEAIGPENDRHVYDMARRSRQIICAWGAHARPQQLMLLALPKVPSGMWCLGRTRSGSPRHPLYLPTSTKLEPFP